MNPLQRLYLAMWRNAFIRQNVILIFPCHLVTILGIVALVNEWDPLIIWLIGIFDGVFYASMVDGAKQRGVWS